MKRPIFVRELTDDECQALEEGLRSSEAFVLRRAQILLASARGTWVPQIAESLGCNPQTVRNAIHAFNDHGLDALQRHPPVPKTIRAAFDAEGLVRVKEVLHQSPRDYGKEASLWTLTLAAEVSYEQGLTDHQVSYETIRTAMGRLGKRWQRAKRWIQSPDPEYARKKGVGATWSGPAVRRLCRLGGQLAPAGTPCGHYLPLTGISMVLLVHGHRHLRFPPSLPPREPSL